MLFSTGWPICNLFPMMSNTKYPIVMVGEGCIIFTFERDLKSKMQSDFLTVKRDDSQATLGKIAGSLQTK